MQFHVTVIVAFLSFCTVCRAEWPALPDRNGAVEIAVQEWPQRPGPRSVRVRISYPDGTLTGVSEKTGVMLTLHNWGGEDCAGTASPDVLAPRLNVVAVCVNYLQSGRKASVEDPEPYDCGYLQALDALRALWYVCDGLQSNETPFDSGRIYCTGGSGGGNVTLMANKLAPRTFACVVDMCGMKKLSHDIAFNLPGGTGLDARWSRDPASPAYLSPDHQELRFVGHPGHLRAMKALDATSKVIVVHGVDDTTCPYPDAVELVENMQTAGLDVEPHFVEDEDLDGAVFTSSGHALGNRTEIVFRVAGQYLQPDSPDMLRREAPSDFERREDVRYGTSGGAFVISYEKGYPVGRFEPTAAPPPYREHQDLTYYLDGDGKSRPIETAADWEMRRQHILAHMQRVMGRLPGATSRIPLNVEVIDEFHKKQLLWRKISFQSDPFDRVTAWLLLPTGANETGGKKGDPLPAVLCLHQTTQSGKDEPTGLAGSPNMHYAIELSRRGYITLSPDYPSLGEHAYDFDANPEYVSGTMKAVWDNIRAVDLLTSMPEVDADRIGVIGHSLGGHNAMFTAAFEPRLRVIVSSCGFTSFLKDDVPSWTGPRYMPRIATQFDNDAERVPFDFTEIVASFAPRPFLAIAATGDTDFDVTGVQDVIESAGLVYRVFDEADRLQAVYPDGPHDFPPHAREQAYEFLDRHLMQ